MLHKRCDIRDWLDNQIVFWRDQRNKAEGTDTDTWALAIHYIDAYQSVRLEIFEEALPNE